jgi:formyltetrahydrofolate synthetase
VIKSIAVAAGAQGAYATNYWARGSAGGMELAKAVIEACEQEKHFHFLYPLNMSIEEKPLLLPNECMERQS